MTTAFTVNGTTTYEPDVPLAELRVGDLVLGLHEDGRVTRSLHRVTGPFGEHFVPSEGFLLRAYDRFTRPFTSEERVPGVLVEEVSGGSPGLFAEDTTPTLDRAISWI
jgi:hypothetical protein